MSSIQVWSYISLRLSLSLSCQSFAYFPCLDMNMVKVSISGTIQVHGAWGGVGGFYDWNFAWQFVEKTRNFLHFVLILICVARCRQKAHCCAFTFRTVHARGGGVLPAGLPPACIEFKWKQQQMSMADDERQIEKRVAFSNIKCRTMFGRNSAALSPIEWGPDMRYQYHDISYINTYIYNIYHGLFVNRLKS